MKRRLILSFWSLCICGYAAAQTLTGMVRDKQTKQPIPNADVYLMGTSYFTLTDSTGRFELSIRKQINSPLIISHLTYGSQTFNNLNAIPAVIWMEEKAADLSEVSVVGKMRYSKEKKLDVFRRFFLGVTAAGKACRILNEEDIELIYDSKNRQLRATCKKPLRIDNKYLGYEIQYELLSFVVAYSRDAMADKWLQYSLYSGHSVFKDTAPGNERILRRRKDAYRGSAENFFRHLIMGDLEQSHWRLIKGGHLLTPTACFLVTDTLSMKKITLLPAIQGHTATYMKPPYGEVWLINKDKPALGNAYKNNVDYNAPRSAIAFFTTELLVDSYGNVSPWDAVSFSGEMNEKRMGDMLPYDYEP